MSEPVLVIDNGSYEIKFGESGWDQPLRALNCLTKDKYSRFHLSNQTKKMRDISQALIRRPHELGQLVSWELESEVWDYCFYNEDDFHWNLTHDNDTKDHHLVVSETLMTIPELSKNMDQVIFEEYDFKSMFKGPVAQYIPFYQGQYQDDAMTAAEDKKTSSYKDFQLVIDSGFNCTWAVPIIKGVPYYKAIKKLDIGGRFLTGLLQETISFRHYNVMEETILVNNIKEQCTFVPPESYFSSFHNKMNTKVEYVLPDFQTSFLGYVKKPGKEKLTDDAQTLLLTDEVFSVPETFFHPEIAQILKPGIVETILECINMCPEVVRPLLVANIVCTGGNFNIPNFHERLQTELQRQCPIDWSCKVHSPQEKDKSLHGWESMKDFANSDQFRSARVTREEYLEHGLDWCTKNRFGYQQWL
ncbi:Arp6p [Kluyveromyces lactis]|uniref:Actin-like protein ARP6 n=1 Tax=Kluyveromyces lactis (strain ATCC 8585 / CBS 2359 / DSM 70799 / NBRC 1267 / NRRL Y-1140 / WM37) TaxID=284590 RepID=ARP6_KLULA|nr:uncharacterized protein KLLA0_F19063g [Kluyveromyces lactis]Q6CJF4.1 RecName: Full=Actin-like protein ARP6 [Kluyveromyces lactis NRRL Y-1140]CAG98643.1 KLLA0F19063p [Kluyveromyces lactis]|eukprot:XP_455935.1 uncharacterized protein KLLA0_F19063g [Kluyveromyces lactis]